MTGIGRLRAALLCVLVGAVCLAASTAAHPVTDDVVESITIECIVVPSGEPDAADAARKAPQPAGNDYDDRLYRADLSRAKRWGS